MKSKYEKAFEYMTNAARQYLNTTVFSLTKLRTTILHSAHFIYPDVLNSDDIDEIMKIVLKEYDLPE
jgi:hypothetical protein